MIQLYKTVKRTREDGVSYWIASEVLTLMGYDNPAEGEELIQKAKELRGAVGTETDFVAFNDAEDGEAEASRDYCLSKKACRLLAEAADGSKPGVNEARVYFAQKRKKDSPAWKLAVGVLIAIPLFWLAVITVLFIKDSKEQSKGRKNESIDEQLRQEAVSAGYDLVITDRHPEIITIEGVEYYEAEAPKDQAFDKVVFRRDAEYRKGVSGNGYEDLNPNYKAELYCKKTEMLDDARMLVEPYCLIRPERRTIDNNAINVLLYSVFFLVLEIVAGVVFLQIDKKTPNTYVD